MRDNEEIKTLDVPPYPEAFESTAACDACGKVRPHTIVRLNRTHKPRLCDACHAGDDVMR